MADPDALSLSIQRYEASMVDGTTLEGEAEFNEGQIYEGTFQVRFCLISVEDFCPE